MRKRTLAGIVCGIIGLASPAIPLAHAQAIAGSQVSGVVGDASGGVLPGAEVTITKTDTGLTRTVTTSRMVMR